jgi:hypothetical protein
VFGDGGVEFFQRESLAEIFAHLHFAVLAMTPDEAEKLLVREGDVVPLCGSHVGVQHEGF